MINKSIKTPAYIFNINYISNKGSEISDRANEVGTNLFYSLKALNCPEILNQMKSMIDGFSASSLYEALLARELLDVPGNIFYTSPGIRADEIEHLCNLCNYISFNSLNQWDRYKLKVIKKTSPGLRINPQLSFVKDERYNPVAKYSKLGVPLDQLIKVLESEPSRLDGLEGVHFHTNSESTDFSPLLETVRCLDKTISPLLKQVQWINLGGGYYFNEDMNYEPFEEAINLLKSKYNLEVIIEPGVALVQEAGSLVSSVIDLFESESKTIAILDTTVNHAPEVFEYQYSPDVVGHTDSGEHEYILAGCSCLAGDLFGEYCFDEPLEIGSRIVFEDMAAYSLVKANMFNGINLPTIYKYSEQNGLELIKEYTYEDFRSRLGESSNETLRERIKNTRYEKSSKVTNISRG